MRLFLSSFRAGKHANELIKLVGSGTEFAYISNAKDYKNSGDRKAKIKENLDYWRSIGLKPVEVDLRPNFHKSGAEGLLKNYGFIWLGGGNAFEYVDNLEKEKIPYKKMTDEHAILINGDKEEFLS
jgi:dipeptidase E